MNYIYGWDAFSHYKTEGKKLNLTNAAAFQFLVYDQFTRVFKPKVLNFILSFEKWHHVHIEVP